jgi:L-fuculose-phosphate aldolase
MEAVVRDKANYHQQTTERMERHFAVPRWSVRQKLALGCRALALGGHESALAGKLSGARRHALNLRMLRYGLGLDEITADILLLVDDDLNVLEGDGMVNPSNRFHLWNDRAKPHVSALSMTGVPLAAALPASMG